MRAKNPALRRRLRLIAAWVLSALLFAAYFALPDSDDSASLPAAPQADGTGDARKLDIVDVSPPSASPGDAVTVTFTGAADVGLVKVVVAKEEAITNGKMDDLRGKIAGEKNGRDTSAGRVDPNVLKKYSAIRMRRGLAVVPVVKGTCQGCHMKIPPQLFIMLQRGTAIETCPTCARIIYWDEIMKEVQLEQGEKDSASP